MKRGLNILLSLTAISIMANAETANSQNVAQEGVKYIKMLGKELKSEVKKRMKDDPSGLQAAYLCSKSAEDITKRVNAKYPEGVRVYRTAIKYRNPNNKPDETDIKVMQEFEKEIKDKTFKKKPVVVKVGDKTRVYVPLITQKLCLKCHGDPQKMDKKVLETIKAKYPNDKAINFKEGDLRGVIVAEMKK